MAEEQQHRLLRYLNDAYAAEIGAIKAMEATISEATNADLKTALTSHLDQTRRQADRLTARIDTLGGDKSTSKAIVDEIIAIGSHFTNMLHDHDDKQTQDTIKAVSLEAFEVATYTALNAYAGAIGDTETADLAQSILAEEKQAHDQLLSLIPALSREAADKVMQPV